LTKEPELVEIYVANNEAEAHVIEVLLESFDIHCLLRTPGKTAYAWIYVGSGMTPLSVLVRKEDEDAARELVQGEKNV